jgi:hypothetical protein
LPVTIKFHIYLYLFNFMALQVIEWVIL